MPYISFAADINAVGFTSGDGSQPSALSVVLSAINGANKTVYMAAYGFTSKPIAEALIAAKKRGVDVRIIADAKSNDDRYTAVNTTANYGIPTKIIAKYKIFHNKFMVIDASCVETGSFNYTGAASTNRVNAENAIVICDTKLAQIYMSQFAFWYNQGELVSSRY